MTCLMRFMWCTLHLQATAFVDSWHYFLNLNENKLPGNDVYLCQLKTLTFLTSDENLVLRESYPVSLSRKSLQARLDVHGTWMDMTQELTAICQPAIDDSLDFSGSATSFSELPELTVFAWLDCTWLVFWVSEVIPRTVSTALKEANPMSD